MATLRAVVENQKFHHKLVKMKIATLDDCEYHFFALTDEVPHILWSCDLAQGCQGLVTTNYDGEFISTVGSHSSFCPKSTGKSKNKGKQVKRDTAKMQEMLVELSSLSSAELKTGILQISNTQRTLTPVTKDLKLPDSIPKVVIYLQINQQIVIPVIFNDKST